MKSFETKLAKISEAIALAGIEIGAIKIRPKNPFLWASGTYNPIYNDNRMFLFYPKYRRLITKGFVLLMDYFDLHGVVIAGTSTSGIPHADRLAERLILPEIYVRDKPKDHGLKNQIEGIDAEESLEGFKVLLIEDLISTGKSSVAAVAAIRNAMGVCNFCFSIFNYGLPEPKEMFAGKKTYNSSGNMLQTPCEVKSLLYYPQLLSVGVKKGFIKKEEEGMLLAWIEDQPHWGEKNGFV